MEVSMEQNQHKKGQRIISYHQQFVNNTLEGVKGNPLLEEKWNKIQKIILSYDR